MILPLKNQKDLIDIPQEIRKQIKLVLVESMDQVLEHALIRVPKRLEAKPAEVVEKGEELDDEITGRAGQDPPRLPGHGSAAGHRAADELS